MPLVTTWQGDVNGSVEREWNNDFQVKSLKVNQDTLDFVYDDDGLLVTAGDLSLIREEQKGGLLKETELGIVKTSQGYSDFAEMETYEATINNNALLSWDYVERDKLGRITRLDETIQGETKSYEYVYEPSGRLDKVKLNGTVIADYGYDANGNRNGGTYDDQDCLQTWGDASYDHNVNGELKSKTVSGATTQYVYDELGNLLQVSLPGDVTLDYVVDGQNRRIGKKVNGNLTQGFLYQDQLNPIAELDGSGAMVSRFVYADKGHVPAYMIKQGKAYRILSDHLGSPRLVVDSTNGDIVQRMDYDVWGQVVSDSNPGFQPFGFAGGLYDQHTGLVRFGARDYDPEVGRWTGKDSLGFGAGDTNLYGYVFSDPINLIDPTGNIFFLPALSPVLSGLIGGGINLAATYLANGGSITGSQALAAFTSGAFSGVAGTLAAPAVGTLVTTGLVRQAFTLGLNGAGNASAQVISNAIDPCNTGSVEHAFLFGVVGGHLANKFPNKTMNTLAQFYHFSPITLKGFISSTSGLRAAAASGSLTASQNFTP